MDVIEIISLRPQITCAGYLPRFSSQQSPMGQAEHKGYLSNWKDVQILAVFSGTISQAFQNSVSHILSVKTEPVSPRILSR